MRPWQKRFQHLLWLLAAAPCALHAETEITLGVFPYVTAGQLAEFHAPLKNYIAKSLGRPTVLVTAPDFLSFDERTHLGEYDLILTAPHFGRLAERRDGYRRVARTLHEVQAVFLVPKDSDIRQLEDLKGKRIMVAQPVSAIYQLAVDTLKKKGLEPGKNITIVDTRTHNNALYAPLRNEADAGITGILLWEKLTGEQKDQLRVIAISHGVPGFMLMAHPRVAKRDVDKLRQALLSFHKTPNGEAYFSATGLKGFGLIDDATMRSLDPYTSVIARPR
jgi:phosphonate transport system substrate-binding protein